MPLKPWHRVVTLYEDLREGRPSGAADFFDCTYLIFSGNLQLRLISA